MPITIQSKATRRTWFRLASAALLGGTAWGTSSRLLADDGPNSSLFSGRLRALPVSARQPGEAPLPTPTTSWYEVPLPPPKEVRVQDIITIRVDLAVRMTSDAEWQRRKNAKYDAILNDWIRLVGLRAVKPAPQSDGDQRVQGNLNIQDRSQGELETTESLKFEIAATVAAVLPNGNVVLEAHRTVRNNHEYWLHSLSGICRREDIGPGNIVLSKDLANLQIEKREMGQVRDSYKRGWLTRWWDEFTPF
jgi:flagellar L-ring protein precursor FlgH